MNPFRKIIEKIFEKIKKLSCKFSASICRSKCSVNVENAEETEKINKKDSF